MATKHRLSPPGRGSGSWWQTAHIYINRLAKRVASATSGNLASLSSDGDLVDSGRKPEGSLDKAFSVSNLAFPATQVPSADPNTLDSYDENLWTPVIADASSGGNTATFTANSSFQKYTKIGNMVTLIGLLENINTAGLTAGNTLYVRNIPFISASSGFAYGSVELRLITPTGAMYVVAKIGSSDSWVTFPRIFLSANSSDLRVSDIDGTTSDIRFQITYFV